MSGNRALENYQLKKEADKASKKPTVVGFQLKDYITVGLSVIALEARRRLMAQSVA